MSQKKTKIEPEFSEMISHEHLNDLEKRVKKLAIAKVQKSRRESVKPEKMRINRLSRSRIVLNSTTQKTDNQGKIARDTLFLC